MLRQRGIFFGPAQARRKWNLLAQRAARRLRETAKEWRVEYARRDGHHADATPRQVTRDGQRHADDSTLRSRIGGLPDLSVERRHRSGVHNHTALTVGARLAARDR